MKILNKWLLTIVFVFAVILVTHAQEQTPVLYPGVYQAEDWRIRYQAGKLRVYPIPEAVEGADFNTALRGYWWLPPFEARGTQVSIRWQGESPLKIRRSPGEPPQIFPPTGTGWNTTIIHQSLLPETISIQIELDAKNLITLDSITVLDRTYQNLAPLVGVAAIAVGMTLFVIFSALRERRQ